MPSRIAAQVELETASWVSSHGETGKHSYRPEISPAELKGVYYARLLEAGWSPEFKPKQSIKTKGGSKHA